MNPIKASLKYPAVTLKFSRLACSCAGAQAILHMPRMEDPSITIRTGIVAAFYPGATSDQVESQLAKKIEDRLFKFAEVRKEKTYSPAAREFLSSMSSCRITSRTPTNSGPNSGTISMKLGPKASFPQALIGPMVDSDFGETIALLVARTRRSVRIAWN